MSDAFYNLVVFFGRFPLWVSSKPPVILDAHHARREGAYILASTHLSAYDVGALYRSSPRALDFVSIVEAFRNPFVAWLYSGMNAFPLDRSRADSKTVRVILERLERGRVVAMFPEGRIRRLDQSAVRGKPFRAGTARLARLGGVPIVPAVVVGADAYERPLYWLPLRRVRYGLAFGEPITIIDDDDTTAERRLADAFQTLYQRLTEVLR